MTHEYRPDPRIDHDECVDCGADFEADCHPSIDANPAGGRTRRTDCDERHGRWRGDRCQECVRIRNRNAYQRRVATG